MGEGSTAAGTAGSEAAWCSSAWFAGPKAENAEAFTQVVTRILQDYYSWRRNYFPEDGVVVDSAMRRQNEGFADRFEDRLLELLARLKNGFPFQSPRYAAHMVAEQTMPAIAGYIAAMLYNPNNVSLDSAPVTVRLEVEASRMIAEMLGYGPRSWAHLTSGGTVANIEALWIARSVRYLPLVLVDACERLGVSGPGWSMQDARAMRVGPARALDALAALVEAAGHARATGAVAASAFNAAEAGMGSVTARVGSRPAVLLPETHHYCFEKALDVLGIGRAALVSVRVDERFRMDVADLEARLDELDGRGMHPLAVVAVVGTTEEGAVDPVDTIVDLRAARERAGKASFWVHADAAYGGYLRTVTRPARIGLGDAATDVKVGERVERLTIRLPEHAECNALERLGECDSITIDPHKLGYIPYPAGAVAFRHDGVKHVARQVAPYIDDEPSEGAPDAHADGIGLYLLEGSKPGAAAAAVWMSHTLIPLDTTGHGRLVRETIRNACELHGLLEGYPGLAQRAGGATPRVRAVTLCEPGSNIVCYAFRPEGRRATLAQLNRANRALHERFSMGEGQRVYDRRFFVSRTSLLPRHYRGATVAGFLERLGVTREEYEAPGSAGVFLLRSVLMNPWYGLAKARGRYFLSELVADLYAAAESELAPE
jgi:glutamate/tyrosine decarboxylase-like PLP-dependent enzyme